MIAMNIFILFPNYVIINCNFGLLVKKEKEKKINNTALWT